MNYTFDKADAIASLCSGVSFVVRDGEISEWHSEDVSQPTDAEIEAEVARLQAEYDAQQYARSRASEYPSIGDQLDALWKGGDDAAGEEVVRGLRLYYFNLTFILSVVVCYTSGVTDDDMRLIATDLQ